MGYFLFIIDYLSIVNNRYTIKICLVEKSRQELERSFG